MTASHDRHRDDNVADWSACPRIPRRWCWAADPPGETLREWLEAEVKTVDYVAHASNLPVDTVQGILDGTVALTPATAGQLARATGISAQFWLNLQHFRNVTTSRFGSLRRMVRYAAYTAVDFVSRPWERRFNR